MLDPDRLIDAVMQENGFGVANNEVPLSPGLNFIALVRGDERYVFMFDDAHRSDAQRVAGRWASNADLDFDWQDAATVSQKVRQA